MTIPATTAIAIIAARLKDDPLEVAFDALCPATVVGICVASMFVPNTPTPVF